MSSRTDRSGWAAAIGATVLLGAALRFFTLDSSLWYDEIVTLVLSARLPVASILTEFPGINAHPLYSLLAHASLETFGESNWALRLPACLFGVASVWMAWVLGARLMTRLEAWAGALVLATSYHHIWFSQNARGYTLIGFLSLASVLLLLRAIETGRRRDFVLYAIACAAGVYTHLTMAFVVAGHFVVVAAGALGRWTPARGVPVRPLLAAWTAAAVLSILLYVPFVDELVAEFGREAPREAAEVATAGWALADAIRSVLAGTGVPAAIAGSLFAVVGALSLWRRHPLVWALLVAPAVVTAAAIVVLGHPMRPRFFFFLSGAAALFVGRGIGVVAEAAGDRTTVPGRGYAATVIGCAGALVLLSAIALPLNYRVPKQDFDRAVRFAEDAEARGRQVTAAGPACLPLEIYYGRSWRCLESLADLEQVRATGRPVLTIATLTDYIADRELRQSLRSSCREVARFPGTLGGGDITICDAAPGP